MLSLNPQLPRLAPFLPPLFVAAWLVSGCLSMVFEEERDLSDFESFLLGGDCDCFEFEIAATGDGNPSIEVRFEGELWKTRDLTGAEIVRLRELSENVVLEEVIFTELISGHPECSRCVYWDDLEACNGGSSKYTLSIQMMERFEALMEELGGVE